MSGTQLYRIRAGVGYRYIGSVRDGALALRIERYTIRFLREEVQTLRTEYFTAEYYVIHIADPH